MILSGAQSLTPSKDTFVLPQITVLIEQLRNVRLFASYTNPLQVISDILQVFTTGLEGSHGTTLG
jgi:hypothetical protein